MSVRGIITSRTTVSPHSKIEWISSRSSCSSTSASAASSTMLSSCSSLENVCVRGRPGVTRLPIATSAAASGPSSTRVACTGNAATCIRPRAWARPTERGLDPTSTKLVPVMMSAAMSSTQPPLVDHRRERDRDEHGGRRLARDAQEVGRVDVRGGIRGDREQRAAHPAVGGEVDQVGCGSARRGRHPRRRAGRRTRRAARPRR